MALDPIDEFITLMLKPGQCSFDIGANTGRYTEVMKKIVGESGEVYAFEPNPVNRKTLFTKYNGPRTHLYSYALSDSVRKAEFFIDCRPGMQAVASSLIKLANLDEVEKIQVDCTTLDKFCEMTGAAPNFIKIDVEGHEKEVIRGGLHYIKNHRPVILFEFWESWWDAAVKEIFETLSPYYSFLRVQDALEVSRWYYENQGSGVVDIGCIPK